MTFYVQMSCNVVPVKDMQGPAVLEASRALFLARPLSLFLFIARCVVCYLSARNKDEGMPRHSDLAASRAFTPTEVPFAIPAIAVYVQSYFCSAGQRIYVPDKGMLGPSILPGARALGLKGALCVVFIYIRCVKSYNLS